MLHAIFSIFSHFFKTQVGDTLYDFHQLCLRYGRVSNL